MPLNIDHTGPAQTLGTSATGVTLGGVELSKPRYLQAVAYDYLTSVPNANNVIGFIEFPVAGTITSIRAKTYSGTCTVTVNKNGSLVGNISATSSGVTVSAGLTNTTVSAYDSFTFDVSSSTAVGLQLSVAIQGAA